MSDAHERDTLGTLSTSGVPDPPGVPSPYGDAPEPAKDLPRLRRSETHLALQYAVTGVLAASATLSDAVPPLLETICDRLGWDMGVYWAVDREAGVLRCRGLWHRASLDLASFSELSRRTTFVRGEGLPGRVWATGKPALIPDVVDDLGFPRASTASAEGLHGAVGFPIVVGGVTQGVLECFSHDIGDLSADLVEALTILGIQIGQFIERTRSEDARRETETRRASMLETALDAIVSMDHTGCIVEFNPSAERTFGYSRMEAVGRELADLIIPEHLREQHRAGLAHYLETGHGPLVGHRVEVMAIRADGSSFPAELSITRVPLDGPPLFTGYIRDITERTWIEEERAALLDRERRARAEAVARAAERDAVFEAMADGVFVCDRDGKTLRMNRAFREMLAIPVSRVTSYSAATLDDRGGLLAMRDASGQPLPKEMWPVSRLLRGETLTGGKVDVTVRAMDGRDVLLSVSGAPLYDDAGLLVGGVCICRDVTERRRWERRTHEALEALLAMAEALVQGDADAHGAETDAPRETEAVARRLVSLTRSVLGCRRVSMTTYDAETGTARPLAVVGVTPDDESAWRSGQPGTALREYLDDVHLERLFAEDVLVIHAADTRARALPYGIQTLLVALMRVGQNVVGVLSLDHGGMTHAYTPDEVALARAVAKLSGLVIERERLLREREEARANEAALRESNRRMDAFLGIAGHEMRTPLTTIKGNLQLAHRRLGLLQLREDASDATTARALAEARHLLDRTDAHMNRLTGLIDDLLDVSRIQVGRLELRRRPCDLAALVRDVVHEQRDVAATRTIRLDLAEDETAPVEADAERIGQVVANYLSNAIKYSSEDRPVTVGLRLEGATARVWVSDEGPGLPDGEGERIWERFYQVAGTEHRHGSSVGLGMGLYISRTIVEQHGGAVGVESIPGKGATFWFTLPVGSRQ